MSPNRITSSTESEGCNSCGEAFDDRPSPQELEHAYISRIVISHSTKVISLTVHYAGITSTPIKRGGSGGNVDKIVFMPDEFITSVEGVNGGCTVSQLAFLTNKRKYGPYGGSSGGSFVWEAPESMGMLYFTGRATSDHLVSLRATYANILQPTQNPLSSLKFEDLQTTTTPPDPVLSSFARNLLSPPITLRIGTANTTFYVPQDLLCLLPFFRAALTGSFREAQEKSITMPEDSPETIAALIEWLYNGWYTYVFVSSSPEVHPAPDLAQGAFHVSVFAIAAKYDCGELAEQAVRNFIGVLERLEGVECLRLWEAAYANGLPLKKWKAEGEKESFRKGMAKTLKELYANEPDEVDSVFEDFPGLATDVLRLVVTG